MVKVGAERTAVAAGGAPAPELFPLVPATTPARAPPKRMAPPTMAAIVLRLSPVDAAEFWPAACCSPVAPEGEAPPDGVATTAAIVATDEDLEKEPDGRTPRAAASSEVIARAEG